MNQTSWKKTFFIIFSGQAFSLLGSAMAQFSVIWWLTDKTGSAFVLSMASMIGFLPQALIGPLAGTLVDRHNRKMLMIVSDMSIALASLVLAIIFFIGEAPIWFIFVVLGIRSLGSAFHTPSMQASTPLIAPEDELTRVAGLNQMLAAATTIVGPMLGISILTILDLEYVLLVDVLGAIIASITLLLVHIPQPEPVSSKETGEGMLRELKAGWKELAKNRGLLVLTIMLAFFNMLAMPIGSLLPLMTRNYFGGGAWHASFIEGFFGVGMLAGGILLGTWGKNKKKIFLLQISMLIIGIAPTISGILPSSGFIWFAIFSALMGSGIPIFNGTFMVLVQTIIDPAALGRVISFIMSISLLASPLGLSIAGSVAEVVGINTWFLISGILLIILGIPTFLLQSIRELESSDTGN